jgi:mono/diheme cytochrome c family protein
MTRSGVVTTTIVAFALAGAGVDAQRRDSGPKAAVKNPVAATAASLTSGRQLYSKNCRHCHGTRGLGDGPLAPTDIRPANLTDAKWDHGSTDGEIFGVIAHGPADGSPMKGASPTLTDEQIWNIVNYIRAIGPPR